MNAFFSHIEKEEVENVFCKDRNGFPSVALIKTVVFMFQSNSPPAFKLQAPKPKVALQRLDVGQGQGMP